MKKFILMIMLVLVTSILYAATTLTLTWNAPYAYNDNTTSNEAVVSYDLRYSANPITDANFGQATQLTTGIPKAPNELESYTFTLPVDLNTYYFAIKSTNGHSLVSALSNMVVGDFFPPSPIQNLTVAGTK